MSEVIITVRGEHELRVAPERAVAHLTVQVDGADRGAVVEQVAAVAAPIRAELDERRDRGEIVDWTSQRVAVWSQRPWNQDGVQLDPVHYASVEITATFSDFAALSFWLGELSDRDGVQVGTVEWQLDPETRSRLERDAATAAVGAAVERASAYATAIGREHVEPEQIADLGLLAGASSPEIRPLMARAASMDMASGAPMVDLRPDEIVISAAVEARFRAR